jgi:hypothetical protein
MASGAGRGDNGAIGAVRSIGGAIEEVPSGAQRKRSAEFVDDGEVAAGHEVRTKRHLVRPLAIDRSFAQLALAVDHGINPRVRLSPALTATCRGRRRVVC